MAKRKRKPSKDINPFIKKVTYFQDWFIMRCYPVLYQKLINSEMTYESGLNQTGLKGLDDVGIYYKMMLSGKFSNYEMNKFREKLK